METHNDPTIKEQLQKIAVAVVDIKASMLTEDRVRTIVRQEVGKDILDLKNDIAELRSDMKTELKAESNAIIEHMHGLFEAHNRTHADIRQTLKDHVARLNILESK